MLKKKLQLLSAGPPSPKPIASPYPYNWIAEEMDNAFKGKQFEDHDYKGDVFSCIRRDYSYGINGLGYALCSDETDFDLYEFGLFTYQKGHKVDYAPCDVVVVGGPEHGEGWTEFVGGYDRITGYDFGLADCAGQYPNGCKTRLEIALATNSEPWKAAFVKGRNVANSQGKISRAIHRLANNKLLDLAYANLFPNNKSIHFSLGGSVTIRLQGVAPWVTFGGVTFDPAGVGTLTLRLDRLAVLSEAAIFSGEEETTFQALVGPVISGSVTVHGDGTHSERIDAKIRIYNTEVTPFEPNKMLELNPNGDEWHRWGVELLSRTKDYLAEVLASQGREMVDYVRANSFRDKMIFLVDSGNALDHKGGCNCDIDISS